MTMEFKRLRDLPGGHGLKFVMSEQGEDYRSMWTILHSPRASIFVHIGTSIIDRDGSNVLITPRFE